MSQTRPGPGGGVNFLSPSDLDEKTSTINRPVVVIAHQPTVKMSPITPSEPKPPVPTFEEKLEPWVMAFKPEVKLSLGYIKWWLYTRLRLMKFEFIKPPKTSTGAKKEIRENIKYLIDHQTEADAIIVVLASKGGSAKTTIIQWLAAFIGYYVKLKPALLGMDVGSDKTVSRFNANSDKTLSVTSLLELVKNRVRFSPTWLHNNTETDEESGLVLFKAKPEKNGTRDFQTNETIAMVKYMHELYPLTFCDTAAGLHMRASDGVAQAADVALVCNKGISQESLTDIRETLTLNNYNLDAKIIKPIVVIGGVLPRDLNTRTQYEVVAKQCDVDPENVALFPYDRYLDDQLRFNLKRVRIPSLSTRTTLMLSRLAKRVVEAIVESKPKDTRTAEQAAQQLLRTFVPKQRTENA